MPVCSRHEPKLTSLLLVFAPMVILGELLDDILTYLHPSNAVKGARSFAIKRRTNEHYYNCIQAPND